MRILAISDIHGSYYNLIELLKKVDYDPCKDKLILLGDYVDRGPKSMETLFLIDKLVKDGAIALIGNHDSMFLDLIENDGIDDAIYNQYYYQLGTFKTILDYKRLSLKEKNEIKIILKNLLPYYELDKYIFVHAGINSKIKLEKNRFQDIIWLREEFYNNKGYDDKIIIFGHTPTCNLNESNLCKIWYDKKFNDKIGIDCACVYGGRLACLDLTNKKEYYV